MLDDADHLSVLAAECRRVIAFAAAARDPAGGFGRLDEDGRLDPASPVETYLTGRMTHVFALGHLLGLPGSEALAGHGVEALAGLLRDPGYDGWYAAVRPGDDGKKAYEHAFVVLGASSAAVAGLPGAAGLLAAALAVQERYFWRADDGMVVEEWDRPWRTLDPYRGVNANMHTVEAYLAAADVTGDARWRERALRITERVVHGFARGNGWMLPEHFDASWTPRPDYNRDQPAHQFRPYGVTIGHLLEWSRLALDVRAALGEAAPDWLLPDAAGLFATALERGWAVDGADGFVYTIDWDGRPVVRQRMHWVVAEALAAAATLYRITGDASYDEAYARTWAYAERYLIDRDRGSWRHELDERNRPAATVWPGKPDAYHVVQATLVPLLPAAPTLATALSRGLLTAG
ncbi:MAG TPA: AGE family epimerase/isomerase [Mycobacteriales bacterium]|nr:AGE family epimerase/isomerase [Mycobacteriales bacterium]